MQENIENNTNNFLVPLGSNGLVRLGNSIAITEKLLSESNLLFTKKFNGELIGIIEFNQETYFITIGKNEKNCYFINRKGKLIILDVKKRHFDEISILPKNQTIDKYGLNTTYIYLHDEVIYSIINGNTFGIYDISKKYYYSYDPKFTLPGYTTFHLLFPVYDKIYGFYEVSVENEEEFPQYENYLRVYNKNFDVLYEFRTIDDFYFTKCVYNNEYIYAINENGVEEHQGKILKQSTLDNKHSLIDAFESSWVEDFEILIDKTIICYSNFVFGKNDSLLKIIDSSNNIVLFEIEFKEIIRSFSLSNDKSVLALLFNNGEVLLFSIKNQRLEEFRHFHYNELVDTDYEVYPIHIQPPPIFELLTNELIIGNRKLINIYN